MSEHERDPFATRSSIFIKLQNDKPRPRELAWQQFHDKYGPIIAAFARHCGGSPQDIDDIVQDVMLGFFQTSPKFEYDPAKGRFRGYLKTATINVIRNRMGKKAKLYEVPLEQVTVERPAELDEVWEAKWLPL